MPAIHETPVSIHAPPSRCVDAVGARPVHPRRRAVECGVGARVVNERLLDRRVMPLLPQHDAPGQRIHFLRSILFQRLGSAWFLEAGFQVRPGAILCAAQLDHIPPVGRIHRQSGTHREPAGRSIGALENHGDHAVSRIARSVESHILRSRLPTALNALLLSSALRVWFVHFLENRRRGGGFDRLGAAPCIARRGDAVRLAVVGPDALDRFEKEPGAREIHPLSAHRGPFIRASHALGAELPAQPVDIIHQHDALHPEPRRLHRHRAGRLTPADDEEIGLDGLGGSGCHPAQARQKYRRHATNKEIVGQTRGHGGM